MEKKLQRNEQDKMLAGVCSGLADYFSIDVTLVRIAFVVATLAGFSGVLAYAILWIAVPLKPFNYASGNNTDYRVYQNSSVAGYPIADPNHPDYNPAIKIRKNNNGKVIIGLFMIVFGAFFLLDEFNFIPYWFDFEKLWPLVFIIPGILLIARSGKKKTYKSDAPEKQEAEAKTDDVQTDPLTNPVSESNSIIANPDQNVKL